MSAAGDSMAFHNGQPFSTQDNYNDVGDLNCAVNFHGAWWYKQCYYASLNSINKNNATTITTRGIIWFTWKGHYYSLKSVQMAVKQLGL